MFKNDKLSLIRCIIGLVLSLGLSIFMFYYVNKTMNKYKSYDSNIMSSSVEIESYESDDTTKYTPIYHYIVDGVEYKCESEGSSNAGASEENKLVYYNSKNPSDCMSSYTIKTYKLLFGGALVFLVATVILVIKIINIKNRMKKINSLLEYGTIIKNLPFEIETLGATNNRRDIYRIIVTCKLSDGSTRTFKSNDRYDGDEYTKHATVDLLIDENNTDNYYIDYEINK